jgi:hypothetical protein
MRCRPSSSLSALAALPLAGSAQVTLPTALE